MATPTSQRAAGPSVRNEGGVFVELQPVVRLDDDQLYELCRLNRELRIERVWSGGDCRSCRRPGGTRAVGTPRSSGNWETGPDGPGPASASIRPAASCSPNGAIRSPDASWVLNGRLAALTDRQRSRFLPLCPDFVVELRSPTDGLQALQAKMREYVDNGAGLGWLVDPLQRNVFVYRAGGSVECLRGPESVSADPLLEGFRLDLRDTWS